MRRLCVAGLAIIWAVTPGRSAPSYDNYIAALVNDSIITRMEVDEFAKDALQLLMRAYSNEPEVLRQKARETYDEALQKLLERQLILDEFAEAGGVIPDNIVDDEVRSRIRDQYGGDRLTLMRTLQSSGITFEAYRERIKEDMIHRYMVQKHVNAEALVSPAKILKYYRDHQDEFELGEQVKLRMLVLAPEGTGTMAEIKNLALELRAKIAEGTSFAEMAGIYSSGSQRRQNGDWGWMERDQLKRGLADVAFGLETNRVGPVIALANDLDGSYYIYLYDERGELAVSRHYDAAEKEMTERTAPDLGPVLPADEFYLMLVENRRGERTLPLPEVQEEIEQRLLVEEHERVRRQWIGRLKDKAFVRYF